jgi:hypothetical protein
VIQISKIKQSFFAPGFGGRAQHDHGSPRGDFSVGRRTSAVRRVIFSQPGERIGFSGRSGNGNFSLNLKLELVELALDYRSGVKAKFHLAETSEAGRILVIEFASAVAVSTRDTSYMLAMAYAANEVFLPSGLIYDCRDLHYVWGDRMTTLFSPLPTERVSGLLADAIGKHIIPKAFVVSALCRPALTTLCTAEMNVDPTMFLFDTLSDASDRILEQLKTRD